MGELWLYPVLLKTLIQRSFLERLPAAVAAAKLVMRPRLSVWVMGMSGRAIARPRLIRECSRHAERGLGRRDTLNKCSFPWSTPTMNLAVKVSCIAQESRLFHKYS
jgi:hypothetical protein